MDTAKYPDIARSKELSELVNKTPFPLLINQQTDYYVLKHPMCDCQHLKTGYALYYAGKDKLMEEKR